MPSESDTDPSINTLLQWCCAQGVQIDARIRVARGEGDSICVLSRNAYIDAQTTLVTIPKTAILSIRNCTLAEHIPQVIYGTEAQLGLALALYGELLKGSTSKWSGYLQSLPKRVSIPLFWSDTDEDEKSALTWIKGTMADVELTRSGLMVSSNSTEGSDRTKTDIRRYFEVIAVPALAASDLETNATIKGFKHAYALISSRSFIVDAYHGPAMVPIADAFNHSIENQVHLESDYEVCRTCGSLNECPHDAEDDLAMTEYAAARAEQLSSISVDIEDTCEMVANASIPPSTEVFNTYGEHLTNAQLLVRYGFLLDVNDNDIISWDSWQLSQLASSYFGNALENLREIDRIKSSKDDPISSAFLINEPPAIVDNADIPNFQTVLCHTADQKMTLPRKVDAAQEDPVVSIRMGEVVLERLSGVLSLWTCNGDTFADSSLVFFANTPETVPNADLSANSAAEATRQTAIDVKGKLHASHRPRKLLQPYFVLNDEAKISHHLWIFCVLLALHADRIQIQSDPKCAFGLSGGNGGETKCTFSRVCLYNDERLKAQSLAQSASCTGTRTSMLSTNPEEDVALLERLIKVQSSLESLDIDFQVDFVRSDDVRARTQPMSVNSARELGLSADKNSSLLTSEGASGLDQRSSSIVEAAQQGEPARGDSRKRARTSSVSSSASHESGRARSRIRSRRDRLFEVKISDSREYLAEKTKSHAFERDPASIENFHAATLQSQMRDNGLLPTLLPDYGDASDDEIISSSTYETQASSAEGGAFRKEAQQNILTHLVDHNNHDYDQKSGDEASLPKEERAATDYSHDRRRRERSNADDNSRSLLSGSRPEQSREKPEATVVLSDASVLRVAASTACAVSRLCTARSRNMAFPDLGTAELGDLADTIPPQLSFTRMAAQLALAERVRLENCAAAWEEIRQILSQIDSK